MAELIKKEGASDLAVQGYEGDLKGDYTVATADYQKASQQGDMIGTALLGKIYASGSLIAVSHKLFNQLFCKAQPLLESVFQKKVHH
ncbi:hypothetical protein [Helicobacter ailurogastricus]|uniref:hypothetical protein n=1 Tax=Helicobacter ailurogastricus TaxID=1578720 RepID=UPI0012E22A04|nr:hypothetical protein [Helicobacter ailurogastricus]